MSVVLTSWQGKPAVEIEAADGEVFLYLFAVLSSSTPAWTVRLTKLDQGEEVEAYRVTLFPGGGWVCECKDATYRRKEREAEGGCKHVKVLKELRPVLAVLGAGSHAGCSQRG